MHKLKTERPDFEDCRKKRSVVCNSFRYMGKKFNEGKHYLLGPLDAKIDKKIDLVKFCMKWTYCVNN